MERLRQPELNRYYLELKYISNTHTHTHTRALAARYDVVLCYYSLYLYIYTYIYIYIRTYVPAAILIQGFFFYRFSSKTRTKLETFFVEFTISVRTCT
jgi:hypothetical protein